MDNLKLVEPEFSPEKIFEQNFLALAAHNPEKAVAYEKAVLESLIGFYPGRKVNSKEIIAKEAPNYPARHIGKDVKDMLRLEYEIAKFSHTS